MTSVHRTLAALSAAVALTMAIAAPVAQAHRGRVFGPSFGGPGSGAGELSLTSITEVSKENGVLTLGGSGLAVSNATHDIYVADTGNHRVDQFTPSGAFVRAWGWGVENGALESQVCTEATGCQAAIPGTSPGQFETPMFIAVDDSPGGEGDVYVAEYAEFGSSNVSVQKFSPAGSLIESWGTKGRVGTGALPAPDAFGQIRGIAVAPSGELVAGAAKGIFEFGQSTGAFITRVGSREPFALGGIVVDSSGNFYLAGGSEILKLNSSGVEVGRLFEMLGTPPPGWLVFPATGLAVSQAGELYVDEGGEIQVVSPSCVSLCAPTTTFSSPQLTNGAGLAVDSQHETVYIAETASDKIESIVPEPPASPLVQAGSESVSNVSADSATLEAEVSPRSEGGEEPTSYRFQYTTEESFQREAFAGAGSVPVPDGQLAPSFEEDFVTAHPQGLAPGTVYYYRVVAENAISRKEGKPAEGERNDTGEEVVHTFVTQAQNVFALPDDRAWELVSPPDKHGALIESLTNKGWTQASTDGNAFTYIATAPTESRPAGNANFTQVLSIRAGGSWNSRDLSPPASSASGAALVGQSDYRFFSPDLSSAVVQPIGGALAPLSSEASEHTPFQRTVYTEGNIGNPCVSSCYRPLVTGAPGFANVPEGTAFGEEHCGRTECGPSFLGASPDGSHVVLSAKASLIEGAPTGGAGNEGSLYEWSGGQLQLISVLPEGEPAPTASSLTLGVTVTSGGKYAVDRGNAVSSDGSRVVWSAHAGDGRRLYVRDVVREETVELGGAEARFQTASVDGSRMFFTEKGDLYVFEAPLGGALSAGHVTDLVPGGELRELVVGASEDGSYVYFVAGKVLTEVPGPNGESAQAGQPNLYVYHAGAIGFVAVLSNGDAPDWGATGSGLMTTARVSPNGRWLAFMSERRLTGYDNRDLMSGVDDEEVFLYDATPSSGEGTLRCASCSRTGARPRGIFDDLLRKSFEGTLVDQQGAWDGRWLDGSVPAWTSLQYQSHYLSNEGRLFFNSPDALVPSDTNGTEDVYEYEPPGSGDCSDASATFSSRLGGCVDLISSGTAREGAVFFDASEGGDDVFFFTAAQLSAQDNDSIRDVYDARVGGGVPVPQPPPACEGDSCQSPAVAPNDPTPGSLTYGGPGNPVPLLTVRKATKKTAVKCSKGKKLVRGKCVKGKIKKTKKAAKPRKAGKGRKGKS